MPQLSADEQRMIEEMAERHRVSSDAVLTLLVALRAGRGRQAQFSHPELGGMGQWSLGGMIMIGDMFNSGLKARVGSLCGELSEWLSRNQDGSTRSTQLQSQSQDRYGAGPFSAESGSAWWPPDLGTPASAGAQNDLHYAYFPGSRCLAINHQGQITLYDTGEHQISGVSQQQGTGQSVTFTSQLGVLPLSDLPLLRAEATRQNRERPKTSSRMPGDVGTASVRPDQQADKQDRVGTPPDDIPSLIERLAELHRKGVLTEDEFAAKKAELLSRL
jgi:hypothetical protein